MIDLLHTIDVPYWARPELRFMAAADDTGGDDPDEIDDEDDEDEEDDEDDDAGKTDEEIRAELKAVRKSLEKANGQSAKRRTALRAKEAELEAERKKKGAPAPKDDEGDKPTPVDLEAVREETRREERAKSDDRAKKSELRGALRAAGIDAARVGKLIGLADLEDLDVSDDGEVEGVEDVVDGLKSEWPELFGTTRKRRRVGGNADDDGKSERGRDSKLTDSQIQARQLTGGSR